MAEEDEEEADVEEDMVESQDGPHALSGPGGPEEDCEWCWWYRAG